MPDPTWTITEDDTYVYATGDGLPSGEAYVEVQSHATGTNDSTEGITAGLHKTAHDGAVVFRVPIEFLLPDLPREVIVAGSKSPVGVTAKQFA